MTYPPYLREKARQLRVERKLTIDEIAERLAVGRTTAYYWVRDIPAPEITYRDTPARARARARGARLNIARHRALRKAAYDEGLAAYPALIEEPGFRDFVCLYIAEGYKRSRNTVSLANSDPRVILVANHWINRFANNPVTYAFQYHADQDPDAIKKFWSSTLGISPSLITYQRKSNSGQLSGRVWRSKHGVLTVRAHDTHFRMRLQAWIDQLQDGWLNSIRPGV